MNKKLRLLPLAIAACTLATPLSAKEDASENKGKVEAEFKVMTILTSAENGWDPSEGTAYGAKLKYTTPSWNNLKMGLGFYSAGDLLNLTDFDGAASDPEKKLARGMFVNGDGDEQSFVGEFFVKYNVENFEANGGRQHYLTPLTTITSSTMPNFHTTVGVNTTAIPGLKLSFDQMLQMSFGARAATDWGLIGEGTQTAGVTTLPLEEKGGLEQAKFYDMSIIATGDDTTDSDGVSVLGATYSGLKKAKFSAWNYYDGKISNSLYIDGSYGMPVGSMKLKFDAQYLNQRDRGTMVADHSQKGTRNFAEGIDFDLFGIKATLKGKQWMAFAGYNASTGDTGMYNSWGGDPAYTSSIFSRNAYRENVNAWKIGGKYNFMKNLFLLATYADYGESDSIGIYKKPDGTPVKLEAATDAKEMDVVLVYKPTKAWMFKLFYADRTSEYHEAAADNKERKQEHTRFVASWKF